MNRLTIYRERCSGHGRCYVLEPELFGSDDDGYGQVLAGEVPDERVPAAQCAVDSCPEHAISLSRT
jgi:ferredoxin